MRAGKLRHRVEIQRITGTERSPQGAEIHTWTTIDTVWGEIKPVSGMELWSADQAQGRVDTLITIRYYELTAKDRVKHGSVTYSIKAVMNEETRDKQTVIHAVRT